MLNNARQAQWGGGVPANKCKLPPQPPAPKKTPKKGSRVLPSVPKHATPVKKGAGRPLPNLPSAPSTPSEYRMNGNPDLDSETASVYADNKFAQLADGFAPLESDTASSDLDDQNRGVMQSRLNGDGAAHGGNGDDGDGFVMRGTGRLDFVDNETASQPDLESIHELTSSAWKNKSSGAIASQDIPTSSFQSNNPPVHSNVNHPMNMPAVPTPAQNAMPSMLNTQPPPGYINLLHLPNMLQGLPPDILKQLLQLQQQGQSVVIDANGHLGVHDVSQGQVVPAAGMLSGLGLGGPPHPAAPSSNPTSIQPPVSGHSNLNPTNVPGAQTINSQRHHNSGAPYQQPPEAQPGTHSGQVQHTGLRGAGAMDIAMQQDSNLAQRHVTQMNQNGGATTQSMSHPPIDSIQSSLGFDPQESQAHLSAYRGGQNPHSHIQNQQLVNDSQNPPSDIRTQNTNELLDFRESDLDDIGNASHGKSKVQSRLNTNEASSSQRRSVYEVSDDDEHEDMHDNEANHHSNKSDLSAEEASGEDNEDLSEAEEVGSCILSILSLKDMQ